MKFKSPYKEGQKVKIYTNWQELKDFECEGILLERISEGSTFIIEETFNEKDQIFYVGELGRVNINGFITRRNFRYKRRHGIPRWGAPRITDPDKVNFIGRDRFLT